MTRVAAPAELHTLGSLARYVRHTQAFDDRKYGGIERVKIYIYLGGRGQGCWEIHMGLEGGREL